MSRPMPYTDATELAALIRTKQLSPVEVAQSHLDRIEVVNAARRAESGQRYSPVLARFPVWDKKGTQ
jgi:Asp-tRNA(Asn)/Glu-tRNA(Gln) amidotransferase A subunit family amidase